MKAYTCMGDASAELNESPDVYISKSCPRHEPGQVMCGSWCPFFTMEDGDAALYCTGSKFIIELEG